MLFILDVLPFHTEHLELDPKGRATGVNIT